MYGMPPADPYALIGRYVAAALSATGQWFSPYHVPQNYGHAVLQHVGTMQPPATVTPTVTPTIAPTVTPTIAPATVDTTVSAPVSATVSATVDPPAESETTPEKKSWADVVVPKAQRPGDSVELLKEVAQPTAVGGFRRKQRRSGEVPEGHVTGPATARQRPIPVCTLKHSVGECTPQRDADGNLKRDHRGHVLYEERWQHCIDINGNEIDGATHPLAQRASHGNCVGSKPTTSQFCSNRDGSGCLIDSSIYGCKNPQCRNTHVCTWLPEEAKKRSELRNSKKKKNIAQSRDEIHIAEDDSLILRGSADTIIAGEK
jgi:hypothetical protein